MHYTTVNTSGENVGPPTSVFKHARERADKLREESLEHGKDDHFGVLEVRFVYTTAAGEVAAEA